MDYSLPNNNPKNKEIPQITLDKYKNENVELNKSPLFYLLQIATDERKIKQNNKNNNSNLSTNISLYTDKEEIINSESFLSQDIDIFLSEIIDKNDSKFLNGEANLYDFLIAKYFNIEKENISNQESLTFKINLELDDFNFLNEFGIRMPKLSKLNLENSILKTISNIGISFKNLLCLNVNNCQIEELEGIFK